MKLSNEQLKEIYYGALWFDETEDGYLQAFILFDRGIRLSEQAIRNILTM